MPSGADHDGDGEGKVAGADGHSVLWRIAALIFMLVFMYWAPAVAVWLIFAADKWTEGRAVFGGVMLGAVVANGVYRRWQVKGIVGPRSHILSPVGAWGNAYSHIYDVILNGEDRIVDKLYEISKSYDFKTWGWDMPHLSIIIVHTPAHIRQMFDTRFTNYVKGPMFHDAFEEALGDGIFNSDGPAWKAQRGVASHLFTSKQLNDRMAHVFDRHAKQLCGILGDAADSGEVVDMQELMFCFTFDCIYEIAFGREVNALGGNERDRAFMAAFDEVQAGAAKRFNTPYWKLMRLLNLGRERGMRRAVRVIRDYVADVLAVRKAEDDTPSPTPQGGARAGDVGDGDDLISLFMKLRREEGRGWTDADIVDLVTNFTIAGRDTTASLATYCFYELSRDAAARERVETEVRDVADVRDMHHMQAVFQETLRLWPSVPIDIKFAVRRDTMPCGTVVRPGVGVLFNPYSFNRNPANFERPLHFDPSRWIDDKTGTCTKYDMQGYAYPAFNAGPRVCLGRQMAALEVKTILSAVMAEFRVDAVDGFAPQKEFTVVLRSKNGMPATVTRRK